jgi:hypothetical protein
MIIEGLDAKTIARDEEHALPRVPDGEGEHAIEPVQAVFPELLVEMQQYFCVGLRDQLVPSTPELLRQLHVVVDFPVEDDPEGAIAVDHRLVARRRQVEDRQTAHSEPDMTIEIQPRVIGPAVTETVSHRREQRLGYARAICAQDSYDAAHLSASIRVLRRTIDSRPVPRMERTAGARRGIRAPWIQEETPASERDDRLSVYALLLIPRMVS